MVFKSQASRNPVPYHYRLAGKPSSRRQYGPSIFSTTCCPTAKDIRDGLQRKFHAQKATRRSTCWTKSVATASVPFNSYPGTKSLAPDGIKVSASAADRHASGKVAESRCDNPLAGQEESSAITNLNRRAWEKPHCSGEGRWHCTGRHTHHSRCKELPLGLVGNMKADMSTSVENTNGLCFLGLSLPPTDIDAADCHIQVFGETKSPGGQALRQAISASKAQVLAELPQKT